MALVSGPAGRLAARVRFRKVLVVWASLFAGGLSWYATRVGLRPDYLGAWLPAMVTTGLCIGLSWPGLGATAVSSLHPERVAGASALNQNARQVGGALGVAPLVVILGVLGALSLFRDLWWNAAVMAGSSGVACALLRPAPSSAARPLDPAPGSGTGLLPGMAGARLQATVAQAALAGLASQEH